MYTLLSGSEVFVKDQNAVTERAPRGARMIENSRRNHAPWRGGRLVTALLMAIVLVAGCRTAAQNPAPGSPDGSDPATGRPLATPSITGTVTTVGPGRTFRVEVDPAASAGSDKAQVSVRDEVRILDRSGHARTFDDLRAGAIVSVWFFGPVAESYPVQANAGTIVIESSGE